MVLSVVFSSYLDHDLGGAMPHHQIIQHLPPSTYALLKALSVAPYGLILRKYLCTTVDTTCDVESDQCAIGVLFGCLFNRIA